MVLYSEQIIDDVVHGASVALGPPPTATNYKPIRWSTASICRLEFLHWSGLTEAILWYLRVLAFWVHYRVYQRRYRGKRPASDQVVSAYSVTSKEFFDLSEISAPVSGHYPVQLVRFADVAKDPRLAKDAGFVLYSGPRFRTVTVQPEFAGHRFKLFKIVRVDSAGQES